MKTLSMTVTLMFMKLLILTAATATAQEINTENEVVTAGPTIEGTVPFLIPVGLYSDVMQPGFGFMGSVSYPIFYGSGSRTSVKITAGYLNHGLKDGYYDISSSISFVPIMFGTQQSWGDKVRFEIGSLFGPVLAYVEACDDYMCVESETETYLGFLADMGVKFKVNDSLAFGVSAGFMMYDFSAEVIPMSFTINLNAGYEI